MKPSYEELEEQLNRSRRLCDAALANERVWETAMMQACGEDGPKSVADKFAELQARCAALAAENAGLKDAISCHAAGFTVCEACGEENISGNDDVCRALNETPATDAFLAEVRSNAIKSALNECTECLDRDCIMDLLGISYEDAALREAGAMALHDALLHQEAAQ